MDSIAVATDAASKMSGLVNGPARVRTLSRYRLQGRTAKSAMTRERNLEDARLTILPAQSPDGLQSRPCGSFLSCRTRVVKGLVVRRQRSALSGGELVRRLNTTGRRTTPYNPPLCPAALQPASGDDPAKNGGPSAAGPGSASVVGQNGLPKTHRTRTVLATPFP